MGELVIQTHDFEEAKTSLKHFSDQTATELDLRRITEKKEWDERLFDVFFGGDYRSDHKVTGAEINALTEQIQSHLQSVNTTQIQLIKEFGQVYCALEALDKDYIQAILISIKATEKTSQKIEDTQEEIKKIVEGQRKTLEALKNFKQRLDGYAHLKEIDEMWEKLNTHDAILKKIAKQAVRNHEDITALQDELEIALNTSKSNQEHTSTSLATTGRNTKSAIQKLNKRINTAYWIAGSSLALAVIEMLILILR